MRTKTPELDQRILDSAAQLFAGNHFHAVRMEDIAAEADVGKGTLYRYFKDKEELYLALLSRAAKQMKGRLRKLEKRNLDPIAQLIALVDDVLHFFDEQPHVFQIIQQVEATRGTNHPWQAARNVIIQEVIDLFAAAHRQGILTVRDPDITALVLLGGVRALIRFGPKKRPPDLAKRIVETVLYGARKTD